VSSRKSNQLASPNSPRRSLFMFDRSKLEHFLDSLDVETHFPSHAPKKIIVDMAPRSHLSAQMDKYDLFVQGNFNHNHGTAEFPVYGPRPSDLFDNLMYMPGGAFFTYGALVPNGLGFAVAGIQISDEPPAKPVETPYDKLKTKLVKLSAASPTQLLDPAPPTLSRSPDFVHTITAWRGWGATNGMLEALGSDSRWEPKRAPKANCLYVSHAAPHMTCRCGYWSFRTFELLQAAMANYAGTVDVIGQVEIWGRVIECENGFRSEFAYPKELWLLDEGLESLSWKYGVPVRKLG
jgi:hypothetical protein